jgi:hypothetical protein
VLWKSIENSQNPTDFQAYLTQYPNGTFAALVKARLSEIESRKAQQQAADQAALKGSALAGAQPAVSNGKTGVHLATGEVVKVKGGGKKEVFADVWLETFQGKNAISFPSIFFCRGALVFGQVDYCADGKIYVTDQSVAFQRKDGRVEFLSSRSETVIKSEGGREGDTYSIYDKEGRRYRFGEQKFDSPFVSYLQTAITAFPAAYKQLQLLAAKNE